MAAIAAAAQAVAGPTSVALRTVRSRGARREGEIGASDYQQKVKKIFMENAMRDLSTTLCRGIARQVFASAPVGARLDGRPVLPGRPVPTDGLA